MNAEVSFDKFARHNLRKNTDMLHYHAFLNKFPSQNYRNKKYTYKWTKVLICKMHWKYFKYNLGYYFGTKEQMSLINNLIWLSTGYVHTHRIFQPNRFINTVFIWFSKFSHLTKKKRKKERILISQLGWISVFLARKYWFSLKCQKWRYLNEMADEADYRK